MSVVDKPISLARRFVSLARRAVLPARRAADRVQFFAARSFAKPETPSLAILDDVFPNRLSAFRLAEYNAYLEQFPSAKVYTTHRVGWPNRTARFDELLEDYAEHYPHLAERVAPLSKHIAIRPDAFYLIFLNNAYEFLPLIEGARRPFLMTLYPGGGFALDDRESDRKLRRVLSSPWLAGVISTQRVTHEYLLAQRILNEQRIHYIYGAVLPIRQSSNAIPRDAGQRTPGAGFHICFIAFKYTAQGQDKGYPVFVDTAKRLAALREDVFFHVVGNFEPDDLDVTALANRIRFYGVRTTDFLQQFYESMDIIISPNVPNALGPGTFDGFPTGGCVEAALSGVAIFCTDPLKLNPGFKDGQEIVVIPPDPETIAERVAEYIAEPGRLAALCNAGRAAMHEAFSQDNQILLRLKLIRQIPVPRL